MKKKMPLGVLASGRGTNLQAILQACAADDYPARVVLVLSDNKSAPALERAQRMGIEALYVEGSGREWEKKAVACLQRAGVELVCLAGFMRMLSPWFIDNLPDIMNIHPSLLPAFPGLEAPKQALLYGVKITGCTVHYVDYGMDTGPIILQQAVPVLADDTEDELAVRILKEEHRLYPRAIELYARGLLVRVGRRVKIKGGG